jgi:hypothetical protein
LLEQHRRPYGFRSSIEYLYPFATQIKVSAR